MIDLNITHSFTNTLRGDVLMSDGEIALLKPMPYSQFFNIPLKMARDGDAATVAP
jgi:hypothetical protein